MALPWWSAVVLCVLAAGGTAHAQLVSRFEVRESVISPNGDGTLDSTRVRYTLVDSVRAVSVVVFAADSTTPVDTLRAPGADAAGLREVVWKGRRFDGSPAPEGAYVVTLSALGVSDPDSTLSLPVFVDLTPPSVQILSVLPSPYAPGAPGARDAVEVSFVVANASPVFPGRVPDELDTEFANPSGNVVVPVTISTSPPFTGGNGTYVTAWDATDEAATLSDGEYRVTLTLTDVAGFVASSTYHFDMDTKAPGVEVTSLEDNASVSVVPDSLRGNAFDRSGVDSLFVRYAAARPFERVTTTGLAGDTLRFAVTLADSIQTEGSHRLEFRAVDRLKRSSSTAFNFKFDRSAPAAPSLDPYAGAWHAPVFHLTGEADNGGDLGAWVRVYHNGARIDSVSTAVNERFAFDVDLVTGRNEFYAVLRDAAFNASAPSNTVVVTFDTGSGFFAPAPFAPGASFDVNAARMASSAAIRVFDMIGDLVVTFTDDEPKQFYSFAWNGHNASGATVKKGPLVAVASVTYDDGTRDVFREVFLFDPDGP
jgi:flagellar hook assembly protein FlgD